MTAREEGFVKGKAPTIEQDALVTSPAGVQARMTAGKGDSGNVSAEQVEGSVEAIRAAIAAKDGEQLTSLLSGASKAVLDAVGNDSSLIESLQELPEAERNAAYDYLHLSITDADLLVDIIYQRFGVMLLGKNQHKGDAKNHLKQKKKDNAFAAKVSDNNVDFTAAHAQQIYSAYMCVPQAALDQITFVFSETDQKDNSYDDGYAMTPLNNICLNIRSGAEADRTGAPSQSSADPMAGLMMGGGVANSTTTLKTDAASNTIFSQWTAIHELGHVVDGSAYYSETEDFRACSGWKEFDDPKKVVENELLNGNVEEPYLEDFSEDEKEVAKKVAIELTKTNDLDAAKKIVSKNKGKLSNYSQEEFKTLVEDSHESISNEDGMNLFKAASLTQHKDAWYEMNGYLWMGHHMKRPTHFHKDKWWSYDRDTREAGKISAYQYKFPKEDFAEAYACYYYTEIMDKKQEAGGQMPAKLKAWFDAHKEVLAKKPEY